MSDAELLKSFIALGSVPILIGLVQILKKAVPSDKWYGLVSIVLGIIINVLIVWALGGITAISMVAAGLNGIVAGLAASGAYSTGQTITKDETKTAGWK